MPVNVAGEWVEIVNEPIIPEFLTHLNYVECLRDCSAGISVVTPAVGLTLIPESSHVRKKVKLIDLTFQNLQEEWRNIYSFHDYSVICISWIPVKAYYLIFNQLMLLEYLISGNEVWFTKKHNEILKEFARLVKQTQVVFSDSMFNEFTHARQIEGWCAPVGQNLATTHADVEIRKRQILKILYRYEMEEFKRTRNIERLAGKKRQDFINSTEMCFFDFFYLYRIKANYRDMEFVDIRVAVQHFYSFYKDYFELTLNFYQAFRDLVNQLASQRLGRELIA